MPLTIRRYEADDHDRVWWLHTEAMGIADERGPWDDDVHNIEAVYLDAGGEYLVGLVDGEIVAMGAIMRTDATRAELRRMRVHPEHQRHGYGRATLKALEKRAAELGYTTLHLETTVQQRSAQALYLASGYRETGRGKVRGWDVIHYEKGLGQGQ